MLDSCRSTLPLWALVTDLVEYQLISCKRKKSFKPNYHCFVFSWTISKITTNPSYFVILPIHFRHNHMYAARDLQIKYKAANSCKRKIQAQFNKNEASPNKYFHCLWRLFEEKSSKTEKTYSQIEELCLVIDHNLYGEFLCSKPNFLKM